MLYVITESGYDYQPIHGVVRGPEKLSMHHLWLCFLKYGRENGWRRSASKMSKAGYEGRTESECFISWLAAHFGCERVQYEEHVI